MLELSLRPSPSSLLKADSPDFVSFLALSAASSSDFLLLDENHKLKYYNNNYAHVNLGISKEEFNLFLDKGFSENSINELKELVVENKIKDVNYLWKLDSAYMLDNDNKEILIRDKKKVILLKGVDFSSEKNINIVKDKLNLN